MGLGTYLGAFNIKRGFNMCFNCGNPNHEEVKELVFCTKCEYWQYNIQPERPTCDRCHHPDICTKRNWVKSNPIKDGYWREWIESGNCWRLNADNDCELFKKMEYIDRG